MKKDEVRQRLSSELSDGEQMVGLFQAMTPLNIPLFLILGPLIALTIRQYFVALTDRGIHFQKTNLFGKLTQRDFFPYEEIMSARIGKGIMQVPMKYVFSNGRKLKLNAQRKGVKRVAKIDDEMIQYIRNNVANAQ